MMVWLLLLLSLGLGEESASNNSSVSNITYDPQRALQFVHMSTATFCDDGLVESWDCGPACDAFPMQKVRVFDDFITDAHAIVGIDQDGDCAVGFRGTTNLQGWILSDLPNMLLVPMFTAGINCSHGNLPCFAGAGFLNSYMAIATNITQYLTELGCAEKKVHIAGHSLGAAEASMAMHDLHNKGFHIGDVYTFGQPRVGDETFVKASEKFNVQRVVRNHDPAPHLPPYLVVTPFKHTGPEIYYPRAFRYFHGKPIICDHGESVTCGVGETDLVAFVAACLASSISGLILPSAAACLPLLTILPNHVRYFDDFTNTTVNAASCKKPTKATLITTVSTSTEGTVVARMV